jgi:hypothetical protein
MSYDEPDARLSPLLRPRKQVVGPNQQWLDLVFCVNCGADGGGCTLPTREIFYLCQKCVDQWGAIPGTVEVPEHLVR